VIQLVLQRAGAGGDDRLQTGQQRRHQIGIGFAGAGAGLGQQHIALLEGLGNGPGQAQLGGPWHEGVQLARKRAAFTECFAAGGDEGGHVSAAGYGKWTRASAGNHSNWRLAGGNLPCFTPRIAAFALSIPCARCPAHIRNA